MTDQQKRLWRVWMAGRYKLVEAADRDGAYRQFGPKVRARITRVDEVRKTSEALADA